MPILLDAPETIVLGHGRPNETYPEVKIVLVEIDIEGKRLMLRCEYGATVDGQWEPGKSVVDHVVEDKPACIGPGNVEVPADPAYSTMAGTAVTQLPTGSNLYTEVALAFYQLLISEGIYQGTIQ